MIKYLVMDVDGTLTDGKIYMGNDGESFKAFDIKDGYGIYALLPQNGIQPVIITGRVSEIVQNRCKELRIEHVYQGVKDKIAQLTSVADNLAEVAYIGDDLNDLPVIRAVNQAGGISACPKNAVRSVRDSVRFISSYNGGEGAVRELIDWLIDQAADHDEHS